MKSPAVHCLCLRLAGWLRGGALPSTQRPTSISASRSSSDVRLRRVLAPLRPLRDVTREKRMTRHARQDEAVRRVSVSITALDEPWDQEPPFPPGLGETMKEYDSSAGSARLDVMETQSRFYCGHAMCPLRHGVSIAVRTSAAAATTHGQCM